MAENQAVSEVLQDILRNLQEMVRSEVRLAKVEIRDEPKRAVSPALARGRRGWCRERMDLPAVDGGLRSWQPGCRCGPQR